MGVGVIGLDRGQHLFGRRVVDVVVADFQNRRGVAAAHARRAQDTHLCRVHALFKRGHQALRPGQFARQAVADADGQVGGRGLAFLDHVEMGVEGRDLVHLGLRQAHFFGQARRRWAAERQPYSS